MNGNFGDLRHRIKSTSIASLVSPLGRKKKKRKRPDAQLGENPDYLEDFIREYPIWIFHPYEPIRLRWDLTVIGVMIYVLLDIPVRICFGIELPMDHPWEILNLMIDFFFMVDIVFNFRTGYIEESQFVTSPTKIARRYIRTWFSVDLFTSIPFSKLAEFLPSSTDARNLGFLPRLLKFLKIARMFKLLRVLKLYRMMSNWEDQDSSRAATQRLLKFLCIVFLMAHIAACMWMGVATFYRDQYEIDNLDMFYGFHPESWVVRENCYEKDKLELYLFTLYWSFTTLTTVGYGDFTAWLPLEIAWTIVVMICGTSLFGYIIGNVASLMTHEDETSLLVKSKMQSVMAYMRYRDFPNDLARKIRRHYEYSWKRSQVYNEEEILSELPQTVRTECALFIHRDTISKVPFLSELGDDVVPILVTRLKPMLASHGDMIICEGFFGNEMYFIAEGTLRMELEVYFRTKFDKVLVRKLLKGEYFAEYAVIMDQPKHPVSVRASSYCDIFALDRDHFQEFGEIFPTVYCRVMSLGRERYLALMKELNRTKTKHVMEMNAERAKRQRSFTRNSGLSRNSSIPDSASESTDYDSDFDPNHAVGIDSVVTFQMRRRYHREYQLRVKQKEERQLRRQMRRLEKQGEYLKRKLSQSISDAVHRVSRFSRSLSTPSASPRPPSASPQTLSAAAQELLTKQLSSSGVHSNGSSSLNSHDDLIGGGGSAEDKALIQPKFRKSSIPWRVRQRSRKGVPKVVPTQAQDINEEQQPVQSPDILSLVDEKDESNQEALEESQDYVVETDEEIKNIDTPNKISMLKLGQRNLNNLNPFSVKNSARSSVSDRYRNNGVGFASLDHNLPQLKPSTTHRRSTSIIGSMRQHMVKEGPVTPGSAPSKMTNTSPAGEKGKERLLKKKLRSFKVFKQENKADEEALLEEERKREEKALAEMPHFSFFVLMRLQMWKNRAQVNVAMRHMQSVENRHKNKFNSQIHLGYRQPSVKIKKRPSLSKSGSAFSENGGHIFARLDAMSLTQSKTNTAIGMLNDKVATLQGEIEETHALLHAIMKSQNINPPSTFRLDKARRTINENIMGTLSLSPKTSRRQSNLQLESFIEDDENMGHSLRRICSSPRRYMFPLSNKGGKSRFLSSQNTYL